MGGGRVMKKLVLAFAMLLMAVFSVAASEYVEIEDLNGKNIGVQTAVLYEELIADRVPDSTIQYYTMPNDMILALKSGKVDAYLIEEVSYGVQKKNHPDLAVLEEPAGYINATCIIGNNEKQDRILSELNTFIRESHENGLLAELYDYWITDFDPVNDTCDITGFTGENGVITVAVEGGYEPFSFISNGNISGLHLSLSSPELRLLLMEDTGRNVSNQSARDPPFISLGDDTCGRQPIHICWIWRGIWG